MYVADLDRVPYNRQVNSYLLNENLKLSSRRLSPVAVGRVEAITKMALLIFSAGVGYSIAYPAAIPKWTNPGIVVTNLGVIGGYGTLGTYGLFMLGCLIANGLFEGRIKRASCADVVVKTTQAVISMGSGFFAQIPISEIARQFSGLKWAVATQAGGMWVPTLSQYGLFNDVIQTLAYCPHLRCNLETKYRLILIAALQSVYENTLKHTRLQTWEENVVQFHHWSLHRALSVQTQRISELYKDLMTLSVRLTTPPVQRSRWNSWLKRVGQVAVLGVSSSMYFLQNYLLARSVWDDRLSNKEILSYLSVLSVAPLAPLFLKLIWRGSGHLYDLGCDVLGVEREKSFQELQFPRLSRGLYLLGLAVGTMLQYQTVKIAQGYYPLTSPLGITFCAGNVLAMVLFVYSAMKEIVDVVLLEAAANRLAPKEVVLAAQLEKDLSHCIRSIKEQPLHVLKALVDRLPNGKAKEEILASINVETLKQMIPLAVDQVRDFVETLYTSDSGTMRTEINVFA